MNPAHLTTAAELLTPFHRELTKLAVDLVRCNSVNVPPNGSETAAQMVLNEFFLANGIRPELYSVEGLASSPHAYARRDRQYTARHNLSVRLAGSGQGKSLLLNGHIDTVPPGKKAWSTHPWSGQIRENRLYGLGSFDMKGGLAAQAIVLAALHRHGIRLGGDLLFESVVDEEWGGGGGTLAARLRGIVADAAVISEGTQLQILRATRGGYVVDLDIQAGDASAYFSSTEVTSPAVPLGRLLQWVEHWTEARRHLKAEGAYRAIPDPAPVQVLAVEANRLDCDVPLSVPTQATLRLYFQFLPDEDVDAVLTSIRSSLQQFESGDPFFRSYPIHWKPLYHPPLLGHELAASHPWTECLARSARVTLESDPVISAAPYPCDAFLLQREFGIPTLLFGPCGAGAHNPDEYVETDSMIATAETLLTATLEWCNS